MARIHDHSELPGASPWKVNDNRASNEASIAEKNYREQIAFWITDGGAPWSDKTPELRALAEEIADRALHHVLFHQLERIDLDRFLDETRQYLISLKRGLQWENVPSKLRKENSSADDLWGRLDFRSINMKDFVPTSAESRRQALSASVIAYLQKGWMYPSQRLEKFLIEALIACDTMKSWNGKRLAAAEGGFLRIGIAAAIFFGLIMPATSALFLSAYLGSDAYSLFYGSFIFCVMFGFFPFAICVYLLSMFPKHDVTGFLEAGELGIFTRMAEVYEDWLAFRDDRRLRDNLAATNQTGAIWSKELTDLLSRRAARQSAAQLPELTTE